MNWRQLVEIIKTIINMHEGYANPPSLELIVPEYPKAEDFIYSYMNVDYSTLYWAEHNGYVRFFAHNPHNEHGFGGSKFELKLTDGSTRIIKGPWSSRTEVLNRYFPHSMEAVIKTKEAVTINTAEQALELTQATLVLNDTQYDLYIP
jgi:hypothetical protein